MKHLQTDKHFRNSLATNGNEMATEMSQLKSFTCNNCNKIYYDRTGLWRHNKKCINEQKNTINNFHHSTDICFFI